ncbi:MAG: hypothetical protein KJN76_09675 [Eudoraea sp.]|nr:hypothetical protein [Eudoraea sp.]
MRMNTKYHNISVCMIFCILMLASCAGSSAKFKKEYALVWKETIKSEAWQASLNPSESAENDEGDHFYSSTEEVILDAVTAPRRNFRFNERYNKLVANAYYKIIAEAEKADRRLKEEYQRLTMQRAQNSESRIKKGDLGRITRKYEAHNAMLNGLKSWNIMSEYGSDDLEFFQAEHKPRVAAMLNENQSEEAVINYLVYKLADLYHFEQ